MYVECMHDDEVWDWVTVDWESDDVMYACNSVRCQSCSANPADLLISVMQPDRGVLVYKIY